MSGYAERFWSKVEKAGPDDCWIWKANRHRQGYGFFKLKGGLNRLAHRIAFSLEHGIELNPKQKILHSCDNPPCCNPKHLSLGTQKDNVQDMVNKGRYVGATKLTESQVIAIYDDPRMQHVIAADYGIHSTVITVIKNGRSHQKITSKLNRDPARPVKPKPLTRLEINARFRQRKHERLAAQVGVVEPRL